jgi:hypothetical protein
MLSTQLGRALAQLSDCLPWFLSSAAAAVRCVLILPWENQAVVQDAAWLSSFLLGRDLPRENALEILLNYTAFGFWSTDLEASVFLSWIFIIFQAHVCDNLGVG